MTLARWGLAVAIGLWAVLPAAAQTSSGGSAGARNPGRRAAQAAAAAGVTPAQAEQLFDRYVLAQARGALQLTPEQARVFAPRLRQLQAVRRRTQRARQQLLARLNVLARGPGAVDDAAVSEALRALDRQTAQGERQVRAAYAQVEATLTVRQRARFRVFEQRMARQKLDLMARARRQAEDAPGPPPADAADGRRP